MWGTTSHAERCYNGLVSLRLYFQQRHISQFQDGGARNWNMPCSLLRQQNSKCCVLGSRRNHSIRDMLFRGPLRPAGSTIPLFVLNKGLSAVARWTCSSTPSSPSLKTSQCFYTLCSLSGEKSFDFTKWAHGQSKCRQVDSQAGLWWGRGNGF